jgi:hypothetical protein
MCIRPKRSSCAWSRTVGSDAIDRVMRERWQQVLVAVRWDANAEPSCQVLQGSNALYGQRFYIISDGHVQSKHA